MECEQLQLSVFPLAEVHVTYPHRCDKRGHYWDWAFPEKAYRAPRCMRPSGHLGRHVEYNRYTAEVLAEWKGQ